MSLSLLIFYLTFYFKTIYNYRKRKQVFQSTSLIITPVKYLQTRNFQKFLSDDGNESLQYNPALPPSLDSTYKHP